MFAEIFQYLPLAALVENEFFCLHGGLSPTIMKIDEIQYINRIQDVPHDGAMCDLLWSDPDETKTGFGISPRGCGWIWGPDATDNFIRINKLKMVCRAHQLVIPGYQYCHDDKCITVFSAPNYCYRCGNEASIMEIDEALNLHNLQYDPAPRTNEPHTTTRVPDYFM
jgi:serine/threonine-protein phosphatase 2A catalytic subunit